MWREVAFPCGVLLKLWKREDAPEQREVHPGVQAKHAQDCTSTFKIALGCLVLAAFSCLRAGVGVRTCMTACVSACGWADMHTYVSMNMCTP